jgi:hypothetical protein
MIATLVLNGVAETVDVVNTEPNPDGPTDYRPVIEGYTLTPAYQDGFLVWIMEPVS